MNYESLYAFVDTNQINIQQYMQLTDKVNIKCQNGHQLIFVDCKQKRKHFRHRYDEDMYTKPMTKWHSEWQSHFPLTEVDFPILLTQTCNRRADVVLADSIYNIEFQHSSISQNDVRKRQQDYALHGRKIIWIIHGNDNIKITYLSHTDRYYLEFCYEKWKYESFCDYDYIFIDIDEKLYKIYPKDVKNGMIDVASPIDKDIFINLLLSGDTSLHEINIPLQSTLYVKQQGAGNGKTFGLIQNLERTEFEHYKCFVIVTKQHSAKTIIYNELQAQISNNDLKYIKDLVYTDSNKKYQICYTNTKTNNTCQVLIATIDSLMYALGNTQNTEIDKFAGIVNSIIDGYIEEKSTTHIKSVGKSYKLNKELCLFVDETQDLPCGYAKAIIRIMRDRYIDTYIVGDRLQSINIEENSFTYFQDNEFSYIDKKQYQATNICRRFYYPDLVNFVNNIIPFSKYSLPYIIPYKTEQLDDTKHVIVFEGTDVYANDTDDNKIATEVETIMKHYDNEVSTNNYKPNDFLVITPFTSKNPLVTALTDAIQMYWIRKVSTECRKHYERYVIFHKSEEGNAINIAESENATRIVSIHTSKGDGRNCVFVIGMNEKSLLKYSNDNDTLVYNSLVHVAITRAKQKLYIRLINNGDDIAQRIGEYLNKYGEHTSIAPVLSRTLTRDIQFQSLINSMKNNRDFRNLQETIINLTEYSTFSFDKENGKFNVDMGHHNIRYATMVISLYIKLIQNELRNNSETKKQIKAKFYMIRDGDIIQCTLWQDYYECLKKKKLCILRLTKNGRDYERYYKIICSIIQKIKDKINAIFECRVTELCPLESIVLLYLLQIVSNGIFTDITMFDIYTIIDIYSKSFDSEFNGHLHCECKVSFENKALFQPETNANIVNMRKYLMKHYEALLNLGKVYDEFIVKYPNVNWLVNHNICFSGITNDFKLKKRFPVIGYDNHNVYIIYIKPQFNELNYNDILVESIYDTFLVQTLKNNCINDDITKDGHTKNTSDYNRFTNKKIISVVFSLNNKKSHQFEWIDRNGINLCILHENYLYNNIQKHITHKYIYDIKYIWNYFTFIKNNKYADLPADRTIKGIINEYKSHKQFENMPHFILKFFEKIETHISFSSLIKQNPRDILNAYDNKDYFLEQLKEEIVSSVNNYLGIP